VQAAQRDLKLPACPGKDPESKKDVERQVVLSILALVLTGCKVGQVNALPF